MISSSQFLSCVCDNRPEINELTFGQSLSSPWLRHGSCWDQSPSRPLRPVEEASCCSGGMFSLHPTLHWRRHLNEHVFWRRREPECCWQSVSIWCWNSSLWLVTLLGDVKTYVTVACSPLTLHVCDTLACTTFSFAEQIVLSEARTRAAAARLRNWKEFPPPRGAPVLLWPAAQPSSPKQEDLTHLKDPRLPSTTSEFHIWSNVMQWNIVIARLLLLCLLCLCSGYVSDVCRKKKSLCLIRPLFAQYTYTNIYIVIQKKKHFCQS